MLLVLYLRTIYLAQGNRYFLLCFILSLIVELIFFISGMKYKATFILFLMGINLSIIC